MKQNSDFNLQNFMNAFRKKINSFPKKWNREARTLHLVEEVGEFAEIILQYKSYKMPHKTREDIKNALADILEDIICLADLYNIDLINIFQEIIKSGVTNTKSKFDIK
jgi:NTP pyrophosphatase (non-canonical NTP hydrolase)